MKIRYVNSDLTTARERFIAHGCNAQGVMGSGVAKAIRAKWPRAYKEYNERYKIAGLGTGEVIPVFYDDKTILNCITQERYGRSGEQYVSYEAVRLCMKLINNNFSIDSRVAMSKIGSSLGGGDWSIISEIIEAESTNFIPIVYEI